MVTGSSLPFLEKILLELLAKLGDLHADERILGRVVARLASKYADAYVRLADHSVGIRERALAQEQQKFAQAIRFLKGGTRGDPLHQLRP